MKNTYLTIAFLFIILSGISQEPDALEHKTSQVTFFYPLGTNSVHTHKYYYDFSFNILAGRTGGVDGIEIAGLLNVNNQFQKGFQVAGIGNFCLGKGEDFQGAGIFNFMLNDYNGIQAAGILNTTGGKVTGAQLAGIGNSSQGIEGAQLGGIYNVSTKNIVGAQVAGIVNIAPKVYGTQIAGILNICDSIDGVPIALISYVRKNGYRKIEISGNEMNFINLTGKIGVRKFYTLFNVEYNSNNSNYNTGFGAGFGRNFLLKNQVSSLGVEIRSTQYSKDFRIHNVLIKNSLIVDYSLILFKKLEIFGGPSFNFLYTDKALDATHIVPSWAKAYKYNNNFWAWVGFHAGIRF